MTGTYQSIFNFFNMKKNLFDAGVKDEVIARAMKLTAQSERAWGSMTPVEMLRHCSEALSATLSNYKASKPTTLKQRVQRFMMLNVIPEFPQGAKTPAPLDMKQNKIVTLGLEKELQTFAERVNTFYNYKELFTSSHPYFGNLSRKQWGIISWMHIDHHLRQFGV